MISPSEISEVFYANRNDSAAWSASLWLKGKGVTVHALCEPDPVLSARVAMAGNCFEIVTADEDGDTALLFLARDQFGPIDIVGWFPRKKQLATWLGNSAMLGEDELYRPRLNTQGALKVFRDPLGWLLADRAGVVIVDAKKAAARLNGLGPLIAEDFEHGQLLRRMLEQPAPRILIPVTERVAA